MSNFPASDNLRLAAPARSAFEGVLNVVRFNWPLYVVGTAVALFALLIAILTPLPSSIRTVLLGGGSVAFYLLLASLVVSHLIYDRSPLYRFEWAHRWACEPLRRFVNLHSGFDESSVALRAVFPAAELDILELHDTARMTEPSIARARRFQERSAPPWLAEMTRRVLPDSLPPPDAAIDAVFAILAVHELRAPDDREKLFREISRVLRPGGRLILLEHLRDLANFFVFGPQFVHFYSRNTWLDLARSAQLNLLHQDQITPFVGLFVFEKPRVSQP